MLRPRRFVLFQIQRRQLTVDLLDLMNDGLPRRFDFLKLRLGQGSYQPLLENSELIDQFCPAGDQLSSFSV